MVRAVLLDAGDTLLTERRSRSALYQEVAARHGIRLDGGAIRPAMLHALATLPREVDGSFRFTRPWFRAWIRVVFEQLGHEDVPGPLVRELFAAFDDPRTFRLFDDVLPALEELRGRGLRLGVVSNWPPHLPRILEGLGIGAYFDCVLASASELVEKPAPEIFRRALELLDVPPDEVVHVGDRPEMDVVGARAAAVRPILLDREDRFVDVEAPRVRCLTELAGLLDA